MKKIIWFGFVCLITTMLIDIRESSAGGILGASTPTGQGANHSGYQWTACRNMPGLNGAGDSRNPRPSGPSSPSKGALSYEEWEQKAKESARKRADERAAAEAAKEKSKQPQSAPRYCPNCVRSAEPNNSFWLHMSAICQYKTYNSENQYTQVYRSELLFQQPINGSTVIYPGDFRLDEAERFRLYKAREAAQYGTATYNTALAELRKTVKDVCENTCNPEKVKVDEHIAVSDCRIVYEKPEIDLNDHYRFDKRISDPVRISYYK